MSGLTDYLARYIPSNIIYDLPRALTLSMHCRPVLCGDDDGHEERSRG